MWRSPFAACLAIGSVLFSAGTGAACAQSNAKLEALSRQAQQHYQAGRYSEAVRSAEQHVAAARKRYGEEHAEYAWAAAGLAFLYAKVGRSAEAERLYRRALAIEEKSLGAEHTNVGLRLNNLAQLLEDTN